MYYIMSNIIILVSTSKNYARQLPSLSYQEYGTFDGYLYTEKYLLLTQPYLYVAFLGISDCFLNGTHISTLAAFR